MKFIRFMVKILKNRRNIIVVKQILIEELWSTLLSMKLHSSPCKLQLMTHYSSAINHRNYSVVPPKFLDKFLSPPRSAFSAAVLLPFFPSLCPCDGNPQSWPRNLAGVGADLRNSGLSPPLTFNCWVSLGHHPSSRKYIVHGHLALCG